MDAQTFGNLILALIVAAILVTVAVYVLRWLYRRSTKETAFVRTGFLGEKVVVNGGAFVIPVLHDITPVNLNVTRIEVRRQDGQALITANRMRVDLVAEFFVRVGGTPGQVAAAAQTLGRRTLAPDGLRDLLEGKFTGALRSIAAQMTLEELHEQRTGFADRVRELALPQLAANGLELESVAIVDLDQTGLEYFDPANAFDAEGLTTLTQTIETRRKMRNEIEQQTLVDIRSQNLDTQRRVLAIDRDGEYARIDQEREVETRRAAQRADLARERAQREQEAEQAQMAAREAVELSRMAQQFALTEERIRTERETQNLEIARRRALDSVELAAREQTTREQIALDLALQSARIQQGETQSALEIAAKRSLELVELERQIALADKAQEVTRAQAQARRAEVIAGLETEAARIAQERQLDDVRIARERALASLEIAKRQAFEEAEIEAAEQVERARIVSTRGLDEARLIQASEIRALTIERAARTEIAEIQKAIDVAQKTQERSAALASAETARAAAIRAEEQTFTAREREIAERRKLIDLIAAARQAEALLIDAKSQAEAREIAAAAAANTYAVEATGQRQANEAENLLSEDARAGRLRAKLLDRIEGIVRESVRPLEKIDAIKILSVDGLGGTPGAARHVTDEVIDSALRFRVQAPMIDSLMKELGIEGGTLGRMTDVLRDAKDISALVRDRAPKDDEDR